jgi:hypothetical protein
MKVIACEEVCLLRSRSVDSRPLDKMKRIATFIYLPLGLASISSLFFARKSKAIEDGKEGADEDDLKKLESRMNVQLPFGGTRNLYKSLEVVSLVLRIGRDVISHYLTPIEVNDFFIFLAEMQNRQYRRAGFARSQTIVIEGLSSSGITTLVRKLESCTNTLPCPEIPPPIEAVMRVMPKLPMCLQSALQHLYNYIKSFNADDVKSTDYVIVDRLYHSTATNRLSECHREEKAIRNLDSSASTSHCK